MCGIFGVIAKHNNISYKNIANSVKNSLKRRGPDSEGHWTCPNNRVFLSHYRLSVLDLTSRSKQPMVSSCNRYVLIFNGEIYNYLELRNQLIKIGFSFASSGDTEVLLNGLIHEGVDFLKKIDGMYAFAFYDILKRKLILSRDLYGEKPLYYYANEDIFIFSSEISSIIDSGFYAKKINFPSLSNYFRRGYFTTKESIFDEIKKVHPGKYTIVDEYSNQKEATINIADTFSRIDTSNIHSYKRNIKNILVDACSRRFRSDAGIGLLLSGGVDSTLISCIAKLELGLDIESFTVGFHDPNFDESKYASSASNDLGIKNHCFTLNDQDILDSFHNLTSAYTEPFADTSSISTLYLAKNVSKFKKVVMGGDGADEAFGGYLHNYRILSNYNKIKANQFRNLKIFKNKYLSAGIINSALAIGYPRNSDIYREYYAKFSADSLDELYDVETAIWFNEECHRLLNSKNNTCLNFNSINDVREFELREFLPNDIFYKCDRAFMYYGVESRTPFTDPRLMSLGLNMNDGTYIESPKAILKNILIDYMPKYDFNRRKRGFSIPINSALRGILFPFVSYYFSNKFLSKIEFLNPKYLKHIHELFMLGKDGYGSKVFSFLSFAIWYERNFLA